MKTLQDILTKKPLHFNFVSPESKVIDAIALMKIEDMSYVVVMQDHNYLVAGQTHLNFFKDNFC